MCSADLEGSERTCGGGPSLSRGLGFVRVEGGGVAGNSPEQGTGSVHGDWFSTPERIECWKADWGRIRGLKNLN